MVAKTIDNNQVKEKITKRSLLSVGKEYMIEYGKAVIQERALPDFRDGLKPVHRRILWSMKESNFHNKGPFYKCARVVGDAIGKYHPHSDAALYGALINMANLPERLIEGEGNFGNVEDKSYGAYRYTECRLSKYSDSNMVDDKYLEIVDMVENYDGRDKEPLYLPALVPNLLINGTSGIAVGVTGDIPPMNFESLMPFIEKAYNGEAISTKLLAKNIRFNWKYGCSCVSSLEEIEHWIKEGFGPLYFEPEYNTNPSKRTIDIVEAPPNFNWPNVVKTILGSDKKQSKNKYDFVSSLDSLTDSKEILYRTTLKSTIEPEEFETLAKLVVKVFTNYVKTATNITYRESKDNIEFNRSLSIPELIEMWTNYRQDLEVRHQTNIIRHLDKDVERQDLLLLAMKNRAVISKSWENNDPHKYLSSKLNITEDQSKTILGWSIISIAKISEDKVQSTKNNLLKSKKIAIKIKNNPVPTVLSYLNTQVNAKN